MALRIDSSQNRNLYVGTGTEVAVNDGNAIVTGNVGIGTTSPDAKLEVAGGSTGIILSNLGNSSAYDAVAITYNGYNSGTPEFIFQPKTAPGSGTTNTYFRFKSRVSVGSNISNVTVDGNVGIGTTSPGDALVVKGGSPGNIDLVSFQNNAGNETHRFYADSANDGVISTVTNAGVIANLIQSSGNSYFNGGNVGIGNTGPTQKLQLGLHGSLIDSIRMGTYAVAKNTRQYIGYTRADSGLFETSTNGNSPSTVLSGVAGIRIVNTTGTIVSGQADNSVQLLTHIYNGGSRVALHANYNGNVGIGETNPSEKLHMNNTTGTGCFIRFQNTGGSGVYIGGRSESMEMYTNGTIKMDIGSNGSVQFNAYNSTNQTGTPTYLLGTDASGNIVKTNTVPGSGAGPYLPLSAGSGERVTNDLYISEAIFMRPSVTYGGGYRVMTATGTNSAPFTSTISFSNYAQSNVMVIQGSNVGIGTTNPIDKLNVNGGTGDTSTQQPKITVTRTSSTGNVLAGKMILTTKPSDPTNHGNLVFQVKTTASSGESSAYYTNAITIDGNNANVGIGTDSPGATLQIGKGVANVLQKIHGGGTAGIQIFTGGGAGTKIAFLEQYFSDEGVLGLKHSGTTKIHLRANGNSYLNNGNVGIGTTGPEGKLHVYSGDASIAPNGDGDEFVIENSGNAGMSILTGNTSNGAIFFGDAQDNNVGIIDYDHNINTMSFTTGASRAITINASQNVGIGETSPKAKLNITGVSGGPTVPVANSSAGIVRIESSNGGVGLDIGAQSASPYSMWMQVGNTSNSSGDTYPILLNPLGGNVGIGTTNPNQGVAASSSTVVSTKASASGGVAITELIGLGNSDNDKVGVISFMSQNATAALADIRGLRHTSDTTGKLVFFTSGLEKMRINSNGNVTIGATTDNRRLRVVDEGQANGTQNITAEFTNQTSGATSSAIYIGASSGTDWLIGKNIYGVSSQSYFQIGNQSGSTPAVTVAADNNVGIGTTNPGSKLQVAGEIRVADGNKATPSYSFTNDPDTGMFSDLANTLRFGTGANTRMTIEPSGEVGINTTGPSAALHLRALTTNGVPFKLEGDSNTTVEQMLIITSKAFNSSDAWYNLVAQAGDGSGGATNTCIIERDGDLRNKNNSYGQISDSRLKENITDATPKLDDVMKVKVKNFNFIGEDLKQIGVVAQELEEVFPGLVKEDKQPDVNGEEGGIYKSVKYSVLVPILLKAMQEQQDQIEDLKTRITQLEN